MLDHGAIDGFTRFLQRYEKLFVLTGAGISTASGIPVYRDVNGDWTRPAPVQYRDFVDRQSTRQRYWARSLIGWPWFQQADPNRGHAALADWEHRGLISQLVTQNVDRLHQRAGSIKVTDLHGRLDEVICLDCDAILARSQVQEWLTGANHRFVDIVAERGPDGDAALEQADVSGFTVPVCPACGGMLKPNVVFFGETIPRERVEASIDTLHEADALLVIGSSLMVYSGFRFCRLAAEAGIPQAAINPGRTRADDLFQLKLNARFEDVLDALDGPLTRALPAGLS